jgi:ABC-type antimicrobial peptide transport system permease subunit
MEEVLGEQTAPRRIGVILLTSFAGLALLLAAIGVYGVLAYFVAQHTPEIGIRVALGAQPRDILLLVLRKGMSLALLGAGLGIVLSLAATRFIQSLLFGVSAGDPFTMAAILIVLVVVAFCACYLPARKAARVDPMVALRAE